MPTTRKSGIQYISITKEEDLIITELKKLNNYSFSDTEWEHFFVGEIKTLTRVLKKNRYYSKGHIKNLIRDDRLNEECLSLSTNKIFIIMQYKFINQFMQLQMVKAFQTLRCNSTN